MTRRAKGSDLQGDLFGDVAGAGAVVDKRPVVDLLRAYVEEVRRQLEAAGTTCKASGARVERSSRELQGRISLGRAGLGKEPLELVWVELVGWTLAVRLSRTKAAVRSYMQGTLTPPVEDVVGWARDVLRGVTGKRDPRVMRGGGEEALRWQLLAVVPPATAAAGTHRETERGEQ